MKKRIGIINRLFAGALASVLFVTTVPIDYIATEIVTEIATEAETDTELMETNVESEAEKQESTTKNAEEYVLENTEMEIKVDEDSELTKGTTQVQSEQYDVNVPVIDSVSLVEKGQTLQVGEEFHLEIKAVDYEGEIDSTTFLIGLDCEKHKHSERVNTYAKEGDIYSLSFSVPNCEESKVWLSSVKVNDISGNIATKEIEQTEELSFFIKERETEEPEKETVKLILKDVKFYIGEKEITKVELTDDIEKQDVTVKAVLEGEKKFGIESLYFKNSTSEEIVTLHYNKDTELYEGTMTVSHAWDEGIYKIKEFSTSHEDFIEDFVDEWKGSIEITKSSSDKTPPKVKDFYFLVNGDKVERNFAITEEDIVKVMLLLEDDSEISVSAITLKTANSDITNTRTYIGLEYNEATGYYEGTLETSTMYPTEWYILKINCQDVYGNVTGDKELQKLYETSFVISKGGASVLPTYNLNVTFDFCLDGVEKVSFSNIQTTERITTLKELLQENLPKVPEREGYEFLGWYCDVVADGSIVTTEDIYGENDEIILKGTKSNFDCYAVYDKMQYDVTIGYCDGNYNVPSRTKMMLYLPYGITYGELKEALFKEL